jgi:hypothetical protein
MEDALRKVAAALPGDHQDTIKGSVSPLDTLFVQRAFSHFGMKAEDIERAVKIASPDPYEVHERLITRA